MNGFCPRDERKVEMIIKEQQEFFKRKWHEHFG